MRQRYCKVCHGWHDVEKPLPHNCAPERNTMRSALSSPMYIGDTMEPLQSMVDGKMYTSKAMLRETYKPSGNKEGKRYIEVGNDPMITRPLENPMPKPKSNQSEIRPILKRAFSQAGLGC